MKIFFRGSILVFFVFLFNACTSEEPLKDVPLPDANSDGAKIMVTFCSECHAPPQPSTHMKDEWDNIVQRMQDHRTVKGMPDLSADERRTLISYLVAHAK